MQTDMQDTEDPGSASDPTNYFRQPGYARAVAERDRREHPGHLRDGRAHRRRREQHDRRQRRRRQDLGRRPGRAHRDHVERHGDPRQRGQHGRQLPEYYVVTNAQGSSAQVEIIDSGGASGTDDLVVFGTNQADTLTLNSSGSGAVRSDVRRRERHVDGADQRAAASTGSRSTRSAATTPCSRTTPPSRPSSTSAPATTRWSSAPCRSSPIRATARSSTRTASPSPTRRT